MTKRLASALLLAVAALPALACEGLALDNAHVVEAPPGATVMAAYATLKNGGAQPLTINGVESPDFSSADFHQMRMADGMMHMEKQDTVILAPHASLTLKSGESHLMLMQPKRKLKRGDSVPISFHCGKDTKTFSFPVEPPQLN